MYVNFEPIGDTVHALLVVRPEHDFLFKSASSYCDLLQMLYVSMHISLGKTGSLGPWRRVIVHRRKPSLCQNDPPM